MITCHKTFLIDRCNERGYLLAEVMLCVVSQNGDQWTIDETHPVYPDKPRKPAGPGTELKKLLAGWPFRIVATPNCSCNAKAAEMDRRGIEWCEANEATIVQWLAAEAKTRGLPFIDAAGRWLVRRAIANARKAAG